jgi:hypothetical protein
MQNLQKTSRRGFLRASAAAAAGVAAGGGIAFAADGAAELRITQDKSTLSIARGDRPLLRYRFGGVPFKPYADRLFSPAGVQVLRDSPSDHKHHHALMYALSVDNVNFWEETNAQFGKERHESFSDVKATAQNGLARAGFVETLHWMGPASDKPLLVERRAIDVLWSEDLGATLLEWRCALQAPADRESVVLGGHHYFGLGMRLLTSMDHGGHFFNAAGKIGELVRGDERLTRTAWSAYAAKADGKPVTVAIFDHTANFRHPATMFTMNQPFAYLSATMNEWKEPVTVSAGRPLALAYGVALWDGEVDKAAVQTLYERWLKLSARKS